MAYRLSFQERTADSAYVIEDLSAVVTEKFGEDGPDRWSVTLFHDEEKIIECDERELSELSRVLSGATDEGKRFSVRYQEFPEEMFGELGREVLYDREVLCYRGLILDGFEPIQDFVSKVEQFVEARRRGLSWEQWSREEGVEVGRPSPKPQLTEQEREARYNRLFNELQTHSFQVFDAYERDGFYVRGRSLGMVDITDENSFISTDDAEQFLEVRRRYQEHDQAPKPRHSL
jgi:hypothetical protein